ncbi:hypothetical protein QQX98_006354, partial [Neonectria punicea]
QILYESILEKTRGDMDDLISKGSNIRKYNVLFTAILRMRMLCNRGSLPTPTTGSSYLAPKGPTSECERCSALSEDDLILLDIVFSYWTSTLDLLKQMFTIAGLNYAHIDGRTGYSERSKILNAFKEDPQVTILLMSIETGAVGLNLTVANVVHIVEPQWNPSVEEQAVARALRMGQTREVTIFRYIMKGTVEESIVGLQKKKKKLAAFALDTGTGDTEEKLDDLRFILNADTVRAEPMEL